MSPTSTLHACAVRCGKIFLLFCSLVKTLRVRSIEKSGFRFSKSKSGFPNRTRNPKTSSGWISIKKSKSGFFGFPFLSFDWEIRKRICKTVLVNSGLLFTNYACACKTAVPKDSFSNPFSDFPIER